LLRKIASTALTWFGDAASVEKEKSAALRPVDYIGHKQAQFGPIAIISARVFDAGR
jgi:hypothetical protein